MSLGEVSSTVPQELVLEYSCSIFSLKTLADAKRDCVNETY